MKCCCARSGRRALLSDETVSKPLQRNGPGRVEYADPPCGRAYPASSRPDSLTRAPAVRALVGSARGCDERPRAVKRTALALDSFLMACFGTPYSRLTRGAFIHERCSFLVDCVRSVGRSNLTILDVGCGAGLALQYFEWFCGTQVSYYMGIDFAADKAQERFARLKIPHNFRALDLDHDWQLGAFDVVICTEVIEHIIDDDRLFAKLAGHVAVDGTLIVTSPSTPFVKRLGTMIPGIDQVSASQDGGHVRVGYDLPRFEELARTNGLKVVRHAWLHPFDDSDVTRYKRYLKWRTRLGERVPAMVASATDFVARKKRYLDRGIPSQVADKYWSLAILARHGRSV
jgi:SAM-dependent methyltransferase